jgi:Holliday junction resolvasome RuvABC endonuclease subunit
LPEVKKNDSKDMYLMLDYFMKMQMDGIIIPETTRMVIPVYVIIETFFAQNFRGANVIPEVRALIKLSAYKANVNIVEVSPPQVKKYITGKGNADKNMVRNIILKKYAAHGNVIVNDSLDHNATDAIAIGLTGLNKIRHMVDETYGITGSVTNET